MFIILKERNVCLLELHHRKQNRLQDYDYSQNGAYFITICTKKRHEILCNIVDSRDAGAQIQLTEYGKIVDEYIKMISKKYPTTRVDAYIIMPDHIHMVITIVGDGSAVPQKNQGRANPAPTIGNIIGWFKYVTTKIIANHWDASDNRLWQRSYHDHVIRNAEEYRAICQYIADNPARWLHR